MTRPFGLLCSTISQIWRVTNMAPTNKSVGKRKYFRKKTREIQWRKVIVWGYFALKIMSSGKLFVLHYRLPRVKKWNKKSFSFFFFYGVSTFLVWIGLLLSQTTSANFLVRGENHLHREENGVYIRITPSKFCSGWSRNSE